MFLKFSKDFSILIAYQSGEVSISRAVVTYCITFLHQWSYITGSPINSFEFLRPLLKSLDYDLPKTSLAASHALILGKIFWVFYSFLYPWLNCWWLPQPLILPAEVYKVSASSLNPLLLLLFIWIPLNRLHWLFWGTVTIFLLGQLFWIEMISIYYGWYGVW